ncbi:MAG: valine--tRNA ligase [Erysipelotrichaceae bacterium]
MKKELAAKYNHLEVEQDYNKRWIEKGYFTAGDKSKDPFCIVIPPPNVTGKLHLGHAWDTTLQDIIARYKRLKGFDMLWLAGMDHAGIATQAKVDARLKESGISRYDIGREAFLDHAWEWKEEYASHIREQWGTLGLSLDYSRERFTLDEGLNQAVNKIFIDLYNDGLIYRGERIINWDPAAKTALSNIEVIHKEVEGAMYTFAYRIDGSDEVLHVSTTRPETMFGDVCVVVHPEDERYTHLIGKYVINPANGDRLPIIADDYIEIGFGTGAMKCTPAHDPNDFLIGERHNLERIVCMNDDGTMNEKALAFAGMDRFVARKALVEKIKADGNCISIEKHMHQVGHSERTDVIVEPYLSKQWFVRMTPLAEDVLKHQEGDQKINFYPQRFEKTFHTWLENIEDWCISRQLWWGHRIPAYYHNTTGEIYVGEEAPADLENWSQDEDVLDTWFSSALWPFSTLGWPNETEDLERYFPNDVLVTGYDIIFFWVARMAFQTRYAMKNRPFKDVLIHGLVRDASGRKMSKSLGNGVDPIEEIDKYGADALRFFLTTNSTPGQDLRYMEEKVESSWNFINKVWNASRFVLMNLDDAQSICLDNLSIADKWILGRLSTVLESVEQNMDKYEFALVGNELYSFVWDDFCSWYIELSKANLQSEDAAVRLAAQSTLVTVLEAITKMLHPFMPFVSEEIYLTLPNALTSINLAAWPAKPEIGAVEADIAAVDNLISMIKAVREIKVSYNLKPSYEIDVIIKDHNQTIVQPESSIAAMLKKMAHATWMKEETAEEVVTRSIAAGSLSVVLASIIDEEAEIAKCEAEIVKLTAEIKRAEGMLANPNFTSKAPAAKVAAEQEKCDNFKKQLELAQTRLAGFQNK